MKHLITMFLSSLILFLSLFYYWQRDREFMEELDMIEIRVFVDSEKDKASAMTRIANTEGVSGINEIAVPEIIKALKERSSPDVLESFELPHVLSVYPSNKEEKFLKGLASRLMSVDGVVDVLYGEEAVSDLWGKIKEFRSILFSVGVVLLFFFVFSLYLYINSLPLMRYSRVFILHGRSMTSLRLRLILRSFLVSIVVAALAVELCYLSQLFIAGSERVFLPIGLVYYFIGLAGFIGLLMGGFKRLTISKPLP